MLHNRNQVGILFSFLMIWSDPFALCLADDQGQQDGMSAIHKVVWGELAKSDKLPKSATVEPDVKHGQVLKVSRNGETPQLIELTSIEKIAFSKRAYLLRGKIKWEGVGGDGFLETWTHFPEPKQGAYFSRTMAETGPMGKLRGTSPWREFVLPFTFDDPDFPNPDKIQFNLFLPESGTVWIGDLELIELEPKELAQHLAKKGSSFQFPGLTLVWGLLGILGVIFGVKLAMLKYLRTKQARDIELRRMQALDLS